MVESQTGKFANCATYIIFPRNFARRIFIFALRRDILRVQFLPFSLVPQQWLYTSHLFLLLAFLSRFSTWFIVQYYLMRCENACLRSG